MSATASWGVAQSLRDKIALLRCGTWTMGVEARFVRQVGFPDLVEDLHGRDARHAGHLGRGRIGDAPCSVWDLGTLLGAGSDDRAIVALERPGGVLAFRCAEILSVEAIPSNRRLELPARIAPSRPNVFKALLLHGTDEAVRVSYLLRASSLLTHAEIVRAQQDWKAVKG